MKGYAFWSQIAWGYVATVVLAFVPSLSVAQERAPAKSQSESQIAQPHGGPQEGIKVHGHWSIVIKNPDGSVASHHDFENALAPEATQTLTTLLLGTNTVFPGQNGWAVELDAMPAATYYITQPNFPAAYLPPNPSLTTTLSIQLGSVGQIPSSIFHLSGTTKFAAASSITGVKTLLACANGGIGCGLTFTSHDLSASPIAVQSGQSVDVTVTISFS